jgi:hypothetical protein
LILLVPEVGIEPTRTQGPEDFESSASTSFTTPAQFESFEKLPFFRDAASGFDF